MPDHLIFGNIERGDFEALKQRVPADPTVLEGKRGQRRENDAPDVHHLLREARHRALANRAPRPA